METKEESTHMAMKHYPAEFKADAVALYRSRPRATGGAAPPGKSGVRSAASCDRATRTAPIAAAHPLRVPGPWVWSNPLGRPALRVFEPPRGRCGVGLLSGRGVSRHPPGSEGDRHPRGCGNGAQ